MIFFFYYIFCLGVINIPAVALGMFSGGLLMKRMKLNLIGAAKFAFGTSLIGYVLSMLFFAMSCENAKIAGVTVSYSRSVFSRGRRCVMPSRGDDSVFQFDWFFIQVFVFLFNLKQIRHEGNRNYNYHQHMDTHHPLHSAHVNKCSCGENNIYIFFRDC